MGFDPCDHEHLNFKGAKLSKSRGTAVEVPYFLNKYDPDPLRFYLTATAPETGDTQFSWEDFVERNNPVPSRSPEQREGANEGNVLVATARLRPSAELGRSPRAEAWGNLGQRPREGTRFRPRRALGFMLSFAHKSFDGVVPEPGNPSRCSAKDLDNEDRALLAQVEAGFRTVGELYH